MTYTIVTGASKGIGKAIAHELADQGKNLILIARSEDLLAKLATELIAKKVDVKYLAADLLDDAPKRIFDWVEIQRLTVDTLINNAGFGQFGKFVDAPIASNMQVMHLNMDAMVLMAHEFLLRTDGGHRRYIMNTVSTAAFQPVPYMAIYSATKSFMLSFSRALRQELRSKNVYVTALCPGATESDFSAVAGTSKVEGKYSKYVMTSESVAKEGLRGLWKNKSVVLPGLMNKLSTFAVNLVPQDTAAVAAGKIFSENK